MLRGYRVLARRVRTPAGEVDLVVRRGSVVVAVEVKARATLDAALDSVSSRQRHRVALGLESFLARRPELAGLNRRFDLVAVPIPPSFREGVEAAIEHLPSITLVAQAG